MKAARAIVAVGLAAFLVWLGLASLYTVNQSQQALVVRLGKPVAVVTEPGLKLKAPLIDSVVYYDNRLLPLEPGVDQIILGDQKRIEVETYSRFRIADPLRYYQSVGTEEQARNQLAQIVSSSLRREFGQVALPSLLTGERDAITEKIRSEVADKAIALGIDVVDVRIRRADLPVETSQAIYDRMTSERVREAKELRAQGFEWAQTIRAKAERDRTVLLSEAARQANVTRGQGDAEAGKLSAEAYGRDPDFYDLYRTLQAYRTALAPGGPTLVLSPSSVFMRYFQSGPAARTAHAD